MRGSTEGVVEKVLRNSAEGVPEAEKVEGKAAKSMMSRRQSKLKKKAVTNVCRIVGCVWTE